VVKLNKAIEASQSFLAKDPALEPNTKLIGWRVAEL